MNSVWRTIWAVLLASIAVIALTGNIIVLILFIKKPSWLKKVHNCLILALAIQDILTAIGLLVLPTFVQPADVYSIPSNPMARRLFCSLVWAQYFPFSLAITSVYTCLMLTIDRWFAVMKPTSYRVITSSPKVISLMVIAPWIAGFGLEIPAPLSATPVQNENGSYVCTWKIIENQAGRLSLAIFSFIGMILLPAVLMAVACIQIITRFKESSSRVFPARETRLSSLTQNQNQNQNESLKSLKRLTRMVCLASAVMVVCWLPDQIFFALFQLEMVELGTTVHYVVMILAFSNSSINPFLYSFSNKLYRREFKAIVCFLFVKNELDIES